MIDIAIDSTLKATPLTLGCFSASVKVTDHDAQLWKEVEARMETLTNSLCLEHVASLGPILAQRDASRVLSKSPSRYRGSAEALLSRILQGRGLTLVNPLDFSPRRRIAETLCNGTVY